MTLAPTFAARAATVGLLAVSSLGGCKGCGDDKPYTPFGVASSLPEPPRSAPSAAPSAEPLPDAGPPQQKAVLAPRGSKRWQLGGRELAAPDGFVFEQAVSADFDADGHEESVAWVVSDGQPGPPRAAGEAWLFSSGNEARRLAALPGFVPTGPNCTLVTALARTGPRTVTLDTRADCTGAIIERSPTRAIVVLSPASDRTEVLTLRVAAAAPGETLEIRAFTHDRDDDGRDDVEIQLAVGGNTPEAPAAPFVWLDRAAGPSRDTAEPKKSLERLSAREAARAKQRKLAGDVVRRVGAIRRLLSSLCAEGATPRVFDADNNGLRCGPLGTVVDSLASAEIGAELARGRVLEAFGAHARDGWYFGTTSSAAKKRIEKSLLDAVEPHAATAKLVNALPYLPAPPRYSPLAFEPDGALLVRAPSGLLRVEAGSAESTPLELDGAAPRPLDVASSAGALLMGVSLSCNRSEVALLVRARAESPEVTEHPTALLAPRPGACGKAAAVPTAVIAPVGDRGGTSFVALVAGALVGGDGPLASVPAGSARSADGRWLVTPTAFGLLLSGPTTRLFHLPPGITATARVTDCVPSNDGHRVACVSDRRVLIASAGGS